MQRIPAEVNKLLADRLKVDKSKVTVRVEVDKYVYNPSLVTDIDYVQFYADSSTPDIVAGSAYAQNITSAAVIISPIKGVKIEELLKKVTSPFGEIRKNGKKHYGVDFGYGQGVKVVASSDGIIKFAGSSNGLRFIELLHANGHMTRYLHLGELYVKVGQMVTQGQLIAEIGAKDSYSTGAHLHFEVRTGATKSSIGTAVDPIPYLKKSMQVFSVLETAFTGSGIVSYTGGASVYTSPSVDASVSTKLSKGTDVQVKGKYGEWFLVSVEGKDGYVYGNHIQMDNQSTSTGANPSYLEINNYIRKVCSEKGVPELIGLATAWTESGWKQFNSDGSPYVSASNDWGIMQISKVHHPDAFPEVGTNWQTNVRYGVTVLASKYTNALKKYTNSVDVARSTYSAYNTGSNYSRWEDTIDNRDVNFYNHYKKTPWMEYVGNSYGSGGGGNVFGIITATTVGVRSTAEILENNVIVSVKNGMMVEIVNTEGNWYKVKLVDGRLGYIPTKYVNPMDEALSTDFQVNKILFENFEKFTLRSVPSSYVQDSTKRWKIGNDGSSNILEISGGQVGESNSIEFPINVQHSGRVDFYCKLDLAQGNRFSILDNGSVVHTVTDKKDQYYNIISIPLLSGSHIVKIVRDKVLDGNDSIKVDNVVAYSYTRLSKDTDGTSLSEVETNVEFMDTLTVKADEVAVYATKSDTAQPVTTISRGQTFPCKDAVRGQWVTIRYDDGSYGYVKYNLNTVVVYSGGYIENNLRFNTGGFSYERTLTLSNVVSVDIDFKEDMRAASASITIENFMGYYSPDARFNRFPENGIFKSPFVEYDDGDPWGVLSDNTPIRVYIGYGDNPPRRFTGLIDTVDIDGEGQTLTIRCSDMMKKLINYVTYTPLSYPPDGDLSTAWLVSSVIHDLAKKAGMNSWRVIDEDLRYPDIIIEETLYVDVDPATGFVTKFDEYGEQYEIPIESLPADGGYENPYIWVNKTITEGTSVADAIEEACEYINYWQRCDFYGTYRCTPSKVDPLPVKYFKDTVDIVSVNKTLDYSNVRNHLIITGGGASEHFIDTDLWRACKGERRSASVSVPWADTYGKKKQVAMKLFDSMRKKSRTMQVVIEGDPYLDLLDTVGIEHRKTATFDNYIVKGMRDSWSLGSGYLSYLDLYWTGGNV